MTWYGCTARVWGGARQRRTATEPVAARRAGLVSNHLIGLALCRYIFKLPPVVAMSADEIVKYVGPTIQRYATAD
jgi:hypothetical protein